MMNKKDVENEKVEKNWVDGEIFHMIALWREMEFEFAINAKEQSKFYFTSNFSYACFNRTFEKIFFQIWNSFF
jgi:hypothetical protein